MRSRFSVVMLALSVSAAFAAESLDTQTVKEFRLPEYDEKGNLKSETLGDYAKVKPDGVTEITNLKMNMYKDGQVEASVTAPNCTLDPNGGRAGSEGPVRISRENMVITGEGFYWSKSKERIQIFKNVKVVLKDVRSLDAGVKK